MGKWMDRGRRVVEMRDLRGDMHSTVSCCCCLHRVCMYGYAKSVVDAVCRWQISKQSGLKAEIFVGLKIFPMVWACGAYGKCKTSWQGSMVEAWGTKG